MTNTNLIERLKHQATEEHKCFGAISPEHSVEFEAAALIEQQEAVIGALSKALAEISAHETSEVDNRNLNDLIANESVRVARTALLAAKTHLDGK